MNEHSRNEQELEGVTLLGNQNTKYSYEYTPEVLETFVNKHPENEYLVTFDAYEFTSLCLTGDTLIDVARDESVHPDGIPIKDLVGTEGYVFGFDEKTRKVVARKYTDVRKTGEQVPVVKVTMDKLYGPSNNRQHKQVTLTCTPDHLILVREGFKDLKWVEARNLQPGMHLIASQQHQDTIREQSRYRVIAEGVYGKIADDHDVHHKDHNHYNNTPENLEVLASGAHSAKHRTEEYAYKNIPAPEVLAKMYNEGENVQSLSRMFNVDNSSIYNRLKGLVTFRSQAESLRIKNQKRNSERDTEICRLYNLGYMVIELAAYFDLHETTISKVLKENGISVLQANASRIQRQSLALPSLNHKIISVEHCGVADVYNMEVDDVHNFFANEVVVHNCPKTGQPDLAKVIINYIPREKMVESKSLKLYLFSFRNRGDFHEDCMNIILNDLVALMDPKYLEVRGIFAPRGGIAIFPFVNYVAEDCPHLQDLYKQRQLDVLRDSANRTVRYDFG